MLISFLIATLSSSCASPPGRGLSRRRVPASMHALLYPRPPATRHIPPRDDWPPGKERGGGNWLRPPPRQDAQEILRRWDDDYIVVSAGGRPQVCSLSARLELVSGPPRGSSSSASKELISLLAPSSKALLGAEHRPDRSFAQPLGSSSQMLPWHWARANRLQVAR